MKFSLIIPFVDEFKKINHTVESYRREFSDIEIIVVQNNCPHKYVVDCDKYICLYKCEGKGKAIIEGIKWAKNDTVGFTDADMSTTPKQFRKIIKTYQNNPTSLMVIGDRVKGKVSNKKFVRYFGSWAYNFLARIILKNNIRDHQCGAKVFSKKAFDKLKPFKFKDFSFDTELIYKMKKVISQPIEWEDSEISSVRLGHVFKMFSNLLKMKRNK